MATTVNYNERLFFENLFDPGAWNSFIDGWMPVVHNINSYIDDGKDDDQQTQQTTYKSNISASDILAMPNMPLLIGGGVLLAFALIMKRK